MNYCLFQAGLILAVLGGGISLGTMIYCTIQWNRLKPKDRSSRRTDRQSNGSANFDTPDAGGVQLVGIYRITGHDNRAYLSSQDNLNSYTPTLGSIPEGTNKYVSSLA